MLTLAAGNVRQRAKPPSNLLQHRHNPWHCPLAANPASLRPTVRLDTQLRVGMVDPGDGHGWGEEFQNRMPKPPQAEELPN